ncbi:hypothetical protein, partial [Candidatus Hepatobacter penaei]|uniref:hypothetical protein n=1 Tax=Candidatus Hepatobacter penaei TaxID=1274402 RepID=UPI001C1145B2
SFHTLEARYAGFGTDSYLKAKIAKGDGPRSGRGARAGQGYAVHAHVPPEHRAAQEQRHQEAMEAQAQQHQSYFDRLNRHLGVMAHSMHSLVSSGGHAGGGHEGDGNEIFYDARDE